MAASVNRQLWGKLHTLVPACPALAISQLCAPCATENERRTQQRGRRTRCRGSHALCLYVLPCSLLPGPPDGYLDRRIMRLAPKSHTTAGAWGGVSLTRDMDIPRLQPNPPYYANITLLLLQIFSRRCWIRKTCLEGEVWSSETTERTPTRSIPGVLVNQVTISRVQSGNGLPCTTSTSLPWFKHIEWADDEKSTSKKPGLSGH